MKKAYKKVKGCVSIYESMKSMKQDGIGGGRSPHSHFPQKIIDYQRMANEFACLSG